MDAVKDWDLVAAKWIDRFLWSLLGAGVAILLGGCCYSNAVFGSNHDSWACRGFGSGEPAEPYPDCPPGVCDVGECGHHPRGFESPCWCGPCRIEGLGR